MNLKNPFSKKSDQADIGPKGTSEGSDGSATNEGIEVQAIEFDKLGDRSRSPRKAILFILVFVVILFVSAITGFGVLRSKKKSALAESSKSSSIDATSTENSAPEVVNFEEEGLNEPSESTLSEPEDASQTENDSTEDLSESPGVEEPPMDADTSVEASSNTDVAPVDEEPTTVVEPPAVDEPQPGNDNISSETVYTGVGENPWSDAACPNHNLDVSSYCSGGSSGSISIASFCFGSKRDGDWYWIRSSAGAATAYDSWDYTEDKNGQLTINDLKGGDSYIISLVRDSMKPYDEIISHEFTVPQCQ